MASHLLFVTGVLERERETGQPSPSFHPSCQQGFSMIYWKDALTLQSSLVLVEGEGWFLQFIISSPGLPLVSWEANRERALETSQHDRFFRGGGPVCVICWAIKHVRVQYQLHLNKPRFIMSWAWVPKKPRRAGPILRRKMSSPQKNHSMGVELHFALQNAILKMIIFVFNLFYVFQFRYPGGYIFSLTPSKCQMIPLCQFTIL